MVSFYYLVFFVCFICKTLLYLKATVWFVFIFDCLVFNNTVWRIYVFSLMMHLKYISFKLDDNFFFYLLFFISFD